MRKDIKIIESNGIYHNIDDVWFSFVNESKNYNKDKQYIIIFNSDEIVYDICELLN